LITADDVLTTSGLHADRVKHWPPSRPTIENAEAIAHAITLLLSAFGRSRTLTSGYRPNAINLQTPGAAPYSLHETAAASDIADDDSALARFALAHVPLLTKLGLWCEDPLYTWMRRPDGTIARWLHVQLRPPPSGKRFFVPSSSARPLALGAKLPPIEEHK